MTSSQSRIDTLTVSVTRGLRASVCAPAVAGRAGAPAGRRRGRSRPASDARAAPTNSASAAARPPRVGAGSFSVRLGGVLVLHDALRRGPRGARVAVGGGVGRAQHVDRVGVAGGAGGARLADQVGEIGSLPRAAPTPSASPRSAPGRSGCGSDSPAPPGTAPSPPRSGCRRDCLRSPDLPSSSEPKSHCATAESGGGPGTSTVWRRSTGWANPEASYWVTSKSVMPNCTPGEPSSVADGGDPHPRRLAVGQRRRERLAGLVEAQRAGAVDGGHLDPADLCADGGRARRDGDGGVGDGVIEVDLQPLTDGGLQRVGHPARRRVAVDGRGRSGRGRDIGQRGGIRRRTRHRDPAAGPLRRRRRRRTAGGIVGHPVEGVAGVVGGADRRRMVVDAAVVGLAGQRGVGDGDDRRREPGPLRVGGQQHRPQRRLVRAAAAARRAAAAPRGRRRRGPSRRCRSDTGRRIRGRRCRPGRSPRPGTAAAARCR